MSRAVSGTKDIKSGRIYQKQAVGGMGRMRCPSCGGVAVAALDPTTGTPVKRCEKCGRAYTTKAM